MIQWFGKSGIGDGGVKTLRDQSFAGFLNFAKTGAERQDRNPVPGPDEPAFAQL